MTQQELEQTAKRLGVLVETLELARVDRPAIFRREIRQFDLTFPEKLLPFLDEQVKKRGTTRKGLFRSMLYQYLMNSWEPEYCDTWHFRGTRYVQTKKRHHWHTTIPNAAMEVFEERSQRTGMPMPRIVRSLFLSMIRGDSYGNLKIVTLAKFPPTQDSYYLG